MPAMRLLELQTEFSEYDSADGTLAQFGEKPSRTREQIAREYGQALREFLAAEAIPVKGRAEQVTAKL